MSRPIECARWPYILILCLFVAGCRDEDAQPEADLVRDSAGVRIVELGSHSSGETPSILRIAAEPDLVLANREDDPAFQFVGVVDAASLPNGELAVAIQRPASVRVFSSTGDYQRTIGGPGSGPGEFRGLHWIEALAADTLIASDRGLRRVTHFDGSGAVAATVTFTRPSSSEVAASAGAPIPIGILRDGSYIVATYLPPPVQAGPVRPSVELSRYGSDGSWIVDLGAWPGDELFMQQAGSQLDVLTPPFARTTRIAVDEDGVWIVDSEQSEIARYSASGQLTISVRGVAQRVDVTPHLLQRFLEEKYEEVSDTETRQRLIDEQVNINYHTSAPVFSDLRVGDRVVWVAQFQAPDERAVVTWHGFSRDMSDLYSLEIPVEMRVIRFESGTVIVAMRDEYDRESVRRYRIEPGIEQADRL